MKTASKIITLLTLTVLWSCSNSDDNNPSPSNGNISAAQVEGTWKVSYYFDNGKDETSDFSSYTFIFNQDGSFRANTAGQQYSGSWSINETGDDSSSSSKKLVISINGNDRMVDISDDWLILTVNDSEIRLKDDNPSRQEELYFARI